MLAVKVPATSANLGPGFDTLGLALDLFLELNIEPATTGIEVYYLNGLNGVKEKVDNPKDNLIIQAMHKVFANAGINPSFTMAVKNDIPMGRGLGSSAAAIVAGIFAANHLIGEKYPRELLIKWAVELEGHADNIVPAVVGGLTTAMIYENEIYYQKIVVPANFKAIIAVPEFTLPTEKSRSVLPEKVALQDTVYNLQRACFLLASLHNGDLSHLKLAMDDMIYQPLRKQFIPGFDEVFAAAYAHGALGVAMSGAGPSIIAFAADNSEKIGLAMQTAFAEQGLISDIYNLFPNQSGIYISDK